MIILTEVAQKLEQILNGLDGFSNATGYYFQVRTEGFHIDSIAKDEKDGNFIPVFISSMGGQFNPVKGLKQATYSIPIIFYYPVRFKDDFYLLADDLVDTFVGETLNYGTKSGSAISNISVPQYGEIQNLDFNEFKKWVDAKYTKTIERMEPYMSMQLTLYLSNAAPGLIYGNDITTSFSFTYNNTKYTLENVDFDGASLQSNSQTQSEQEEGTNEADSVPFGTAYGSSFKVYPNLNAETLELFYIESSNYKKDTVYYYKNENNYISLGELTELEYTNALNTYTTIYTYEPLYFYKELLKVWLAGNIQEVECEIEFKIANDNTLKYTRKCFIASVVAPIEKGQLFSLTLTFAKIAEEEQ